MPQFQLNRRMEAAVFLISITIVSILTSSCFADYASTNIGCKVRYELLLDFREFFQNKECGSHVQYCDPGLSLLFYQYPPYILCNQTDCPRPKGLLVGEYIIFPRKLS